MMRPQLIIVMGVSGSGKSTLAKALAERLHMVFLEADDFHSRQAIAHMANGKPLTDAMREPWIVKMLTAVANHFAHGESCVLSYSGLKKSHRMRFRQLSGQVRFICLCGAKVLIAKRMRQRTDHFMSPDLLDSQFAAMEAYDDERDVYPVDIDREFSQLLTQVEALVATVPKDY